MNSLDPWRVMLSSPPGELMVVPAPYWSDPFMGHGIPQGWASNTSPEWEQGLTRGTQVFLGAEAPAPKRSGLTAVVAPVLAPATGGLSVRFDLDPNQILHGEIIVDGKHYAGSIDLGPTIAAIHAQLHAAMPPAAVSGDFPERDAEPFPTSRTVHGVHAHDLQAMFQTMRDRGFTIEGDNPRSAQMKSWIVWTHHLLTTLLVTWDAVSATLRVEITDSEHDPASVWAWLTPLLFPQPSVDRVVRAAGDHLVGTLIGQHVTVACGSFLDDIGGAISGAAGSLYHGVADTVEKLKGPITMAAAAAATGIGGPLAGAAASQLVGPIIDTAANMGKATPAKAAAEQAAKTDPAAAQALALAKTAAAQTIAAYHVTETAQKAADGHPVAQQQIAQVTRDAEAGDPAAHAVAPLVAQGFQNATEQRQGGGGGGGSGGSGGHGRHHHHRGPDTVRNDAVRSVTRASQEYQQAHGRPPAALAYIRSGQQHHQAYYFNAPQEAVRWAEEQAPNTYSYVAAFDGRNLTAPIVEHTGSAAA